MPYNFVVERRVVANHHVPSGIWFDSSVWRYAVVILMVRKHLGKMLVAGLFWCGRSNRPHGVYAAITLIGKGAVLKTASNRATGVSVRVGVAVLILM